MTIEVDRELAEAVLQDAGWALGLIQEFNPHGQHAFYLNDTRHHWQGLFTVDTSSFDALPVKPAHEIVGAVVELSNMLRTVESPDAIETTTLASAAAAYVKSTRSYRHLVSTVGLARFHCILNIYPGATPNVRIFFMESNTLLTREEVREGGAEIEAIDRERNPDFFR